MMFYALMVLVASVLAVGVFWVTVIGYYMMRTGRACWELLVAEATDPDTESALMRDSRLRSEGIEASEDIRTIMAPIDPTASPPPPGTSPKALTQTGIAENRTVSQRDLKVKVSDQADIWLCDGRPILFALVQIVLVAIATALLSLPILTSVSLVTFILMPFLWAGTSTLVVSLVIGFLAYEPVMENTVIGVYRMGTQLNGYLGAGPQFLVPLLEWSEEIPFQTLVWGPQTAEVDDGFHIDGIADIDTNPATGIFAPLLRGRWPIAVIVQVTFHFERSRRRAWWEILNRWAETKELGEQIASAINSVLVTKVRELDVKEDFSTPTEAMKALNKVQDELPETCGVILQSLIELRQDLPVIFERVMISAVKAGEELQQLLQVQDEAWVTRYKEEKAGEAVKDRMDRLAAIFTTYGPGGMSLSGDKLMEAMLRLSELEVQRLFAMASSKDGSVEALIKAFIAQKVQDVTRP